MLRQVETIAELRAACSRLEGRVGLVPTMGALHDGHRSLVEAARAENDVVIASIFVNPIQFAPGEDFAAYPRDLDRDLDAMEDAGVDIVFTPPPDEMYPPGFQTVINVEVVSTGLEGERRPDHFKGVATVVAKLFNLAQPDRAYFGQKDAQQVVVLRRMVRDLSFPLDIVVCPTVREPDGLAMSSRNVYLNMAQREAAGVIFRALRTTADAYIGGERQPAELRAIAREVLQSEPLAEIDYVAVNDPRTLFGVHDATDDPMLLSVAVQIGKPRLLDNCLLPWSLNDRSGLTAVLGA
ncbi:MAG: pantoate--beta-alanine ligase [Anaerolineae bacterium]|nr:pantoate--beta-alanine ligase [Anaerolineae bacterium]